MNALLHIKLRHTRISQNLQRSAIRHKRLSQYHSFHQLNKVEDSAELFVKSADTQFSLIRLSPSL